MKKNLIILILLGILLLPQMASALTIGDILGNIMLNVVKPVAIFAVITLWIVTGILFLVAQGDPGKLGLAKAALIASLAGTVVVVLAPIMAGIIGSSLGI